MFNTDLYRACIGNINMDEDIIRLTCMTKLKTGPYVFLMCRGCALFCYRGTSLEGSGVEW